MKIHKSLKTILYVGVNGDKFNILAENLERAETLIRSGQAIELPESIWELEPMQMREKALQIMKEKFGN